MTQMVNTPEELDALPKFSVVQFRGTALGKNCRVVWQLDGAWFPAGSGDYMHSADFPDKVFPAAVLWMGQELSHE